MALILFTVTARTLALKKIAGRVSAEKTALIVGVGTVVSCLIGFPLAVRAHVASFSDFLSLTGSAAGLGKGILLAGLLIAQQRLIGKSLSATTYVFPLATGGIALMDTLLFDAPLATGGILSIGLLFCAGALFTTVGHLGAMPTQDKALFLFMVLCVVGFGLMDRVGLPASGWYSYLLLTGLGNLMTVGLAKGPREPVPLSVWLGVTLVWVLPELIFNYALAVYLPVSYGYLAITLRIPLLMFISVWCYHEGRLPSQMAFSTVALLAVCLLIWDK